MVTKDLVVAQLLRPKQAKYDAAKFNWIGRPNNYVAVVLVWGGRKVNSFEDIKKEETIMGVSGRQAGCPVNRFRDIHQLVGDDAARRTGRTGQRGSSRTVSDPALLADAKKFKVDISPKTGEEVEKFVKMVLTASPVLVARARTLVGIKKK
jgi:hypothetical protein